MTNKQFELSQEQKSLIWVTKLLPARATAEEAHAFYSVAEEYGLNPLLGDIIFQKFETKYGPRVSYLVTRDALVKHAMRQDDFVNILSGVVKEGDYFELNVVDGVPIHKFGTKRGHIIGSWAVIKTKSRGNTVVFADFPEYHRALSQKNPVWNNMPSAMIEKVAQSMVIKRTFPLGVIFVSEDEVGPDFNQEHEPVEAPAPVTEIENSSIATELEEVRKKKEEAKNVKDKTTIEKKETAAAKKLPAQDTEPVIQPSVEKTEPVKESQPEVIQTQQSVPTTEEVSAEKQQIEEIVAENLTDTTEESTSNVYEFVNAVLKKSDFSGNTFLHIFYLDGGQRRDVLVRGEDNIALFDEYEQGTKFTADIQEFNGFRFVQSAQAV